MTPEHLHLNSLSTRITLTQTEVRKFWHDWTAEQADDALTTAVAAVETALADAKAAVNRVRAEREANDGQ